MLDSNTILGISGILGCEVYEHGIMLQSTEIWPCGVPIVYPEGALLGVAGQATHVQTLITPTQNSAGADSLNVLVNNIHPVGLKPLCNNHRALEVSEFDLGKFDRLTQFVRDVGGISLVIESQKGREDVAKSIRVLEKRWKYTSMFYYNGWGPQYLEGDDDHYLSVLTFLDLPYCVPLFNMQKVDGMGLSFSGATRIASERKGQLHRIFRADYIYSNYEENVYFIDGVSVNTNLPPNKSRYEELADMAAQELKRMPITEGKKKKTLAKSSFDKYKGKWGDKEWHTGKEGMEWKTAVKSVEATRADGPEEAHGQHGSIGFYNNSTQYITTTAHTSDAAIDVEVASDEGVEVGQLTLSDGPDNIIWDTEDSIIESSDDPDEGPEDEAPEMEEPTDE